MSMRLLELRSTPHPLDVTEFASPVGPALQFDTYRNGCATLTVEDVDQLVIALRKWRGTVCIHCGGEFGSDVIEVVDDRGPHAHPNCVTNPSTEESCE